MNFNPGYNSANNHANGLSYDGMGNVTNDCSNPYTYDAEGWPISGGGRSILYDAFGRAVNFTVSGATTQILYDPDGRVFAYLNGQTLTSYYMPLTAGLQAVYNSSGLLYYRHADWLGSSRLQLDTSGTMYGGRAFAPFGESYAETGTADRSFTGQTQDVVAGPTGIYDFLFRQHSAAQGRWLVPDPAGLAAVDITNPQTWNRYAYVGNNPLNRIDPLGLWIQCYPINPENPGEGQICIQDFGGSHGGPGPIPHTKRKSEPKFPKSEKKQTFSECMAANSSTFSLAGVAQGAANAALDVAGMEGLEFKNYQAVQFVLGNTFSSVLYGSVTDASVTAAENTPAIVGTAMGTMTTYGRNSSAITALNIARKGGLPQALSSASRGVKGALGTLGDVLDLIPYRLEADAALFAAEVAYCIYETQ